MILGQGIALHGTYPGDEWRRVKKLTDTQAYLLYVGMCKNLPDKDGKPIRPEKPTAEKFQAVFCNKGYRILSENKTLAFAIYYTDFSFYLICAPAGTYKNKVMLPYPTAICVDKRAEKGEDGFWIL